MFYTPYLEPHWPLKTVPLSLSRDARLELRDTFFKALDVKVKSLEKACEILTKVVQHANELVSKKWVAFPFQPEKEQAWEGMINAINKLNQGQEAIGNVKQSNTNISR